MTLPHETPDEPNLVARLGMTIDSQDERTTGSVVVGEEVCYTGVDTVRASVVLTWADVLAGAIAGRAVSPRIPLTLDLDVRVLEPAPAGTSLTAEASLIRAGRSVVVIGCVFTDPATSKVTAHSVATFVPPADTNATFPDGFPSLSWERATLGQPLADRLDCRLGDDGSVTMPRKPGALNAVGAIQGGLATVAAEEAVLASTTEARALSELTVRYLRPIMTGPARAIATPVGGDLHTVDIIDAANDKVCIFATARSA